MLIFAVNILAVNCSLRSLLKYIYSVNKCIVHATHSQKLSYSVCIASSSISLTGLIDFQRKNHHLHTENRSKTGAERCPKSSKNVVWQVLLLLTVAKIPPRKNDTPKVSAAKSTPETMIFRQNSSIEISTRRR